MRFAKLTAPNGQTVYVGSSMILSPSLEHAGGTLIRTQMGQQEVKEGPQDAVNALMVAE